MMKRKLNNKTLDTIGRRLIESGVPKSVDVDSIISNPDLYAGVAARIATGGCRSAGRKWFLRPALALTGFAALLVTALAFTNTLRSDAPRVAGITPIEVTPSTPSATLPAADAVVSIPSNPSIYASYRDVRNERVQTRTFSKKIEAKDPGQARKPVTEFYALSPGGDEDLAGGRIIRVDLRRSSLFAMGADIPLENDSEYVKADLLIGSDGVTRGIRVVK